MQKQRKQIVQRHNLKFLVFYLSTCECFQQNYVHYLEYIFIKFRIKVISLVNGIDKLIICDIRKLSHLHALYKYKIITFETILFVDSTDN